MLHLDSVIPMPVYLQMNEVAALTHTALLKQASGVAVDAATQLLHRTLLATMDFSQQHR